MGYHQDYGHGIAWLLALVAWPEGSTEDMVPVAILFVAAGLPGLVVGF